MGCNSQESTLNYRKYSQSYRAYSNQTFVVPVPAIATKMLKAKQNSPVLKTNHLEPIVKRKPSLSKND